MTSFFEPINLSTTHIYHSALELSPLSSIIQRLYHHQQYTHFPRIVTEIPDMWDRSIHIPGTFCTTYCVWSPCGRFVAIKTQGTVKIWDPFSSELLSTLAKPSTHLTGKFAYSPDGYSIASLSVASLVIWNIQTGGVVNEIEHDGANGDLLKWSLDGNFFCTIQDPGTTTSYAVHVYDIPSGTTLFLGTLQSSNRPCLWAHSMCFQVMTTRQDDQTYTINISKAGSVLNMIESFCIKSWGPEDKIGSFSPTTYRISVENSNQTCILDIQNTECLLRITKELFCHSFSSDGSLFAACSFSGTQIWKYTSRHYAPWKELPFQDLSEIINSPLQFSPTSSSIMGCPKGALQVWHLDNSHIITHINSHTPLTVISCYGTYMATCYKGGQNHQHYQSTFTNSFTLH